MVRVVVRQGFYCTDIPGLATGRFVHFVADNADHNVATLDGHNTFHEMVIIAAVTPWAKRCTAVARCSARAACNFGAIAIHFYKESRSHVRHFSTYERLNDIHRNDPTWKIDLLLKLVFTKTGLVRHDAGRSPRYSSSKASITFLPMIDMNPPPTSAAASYHSARVYLQVNSAWGKVTIWTQNNGAGYVCGIALSQE